jgi:hypothetical protein
MNTENPNTENAIAADAEALLEKHRSKDGRAVILEYVSTDNPPQRIYGLGFFNEAGEVARRDDETFPTLPSGNYPVLKEDGTLIPNVEYRAWLEAQPDLLVEEEEAEETAGS